MLAGILFALFACLSVAALNVSNQYAAIAGQYKTINQQQSMITMAEGLELYYQENHSFPSSLSALIASQGYQYLNSAVLTNQNYVVSPAIIDSQWTFNRQLLFLYDTSAGADPTNYLNSNTCGSGPFASALSWCGNLSDGNNLSLWYRRETRDDVALLLTTQRNNLVRLSQKFFNYYNANNAFPSLDQNNAALLGGNNTSLKVLANYSGTLQNCSGNYQYQGVPIDCSDLYDLWGGLIGYQFIDTGHVILTSETPVFNSAGNRIVIAVDL